ncbi:uncharacterized protein [Anabrus simplex]|uniref:uncharacterized protein n=1 Tax=Anabrus simplex TaxID=316456 RepID=UPI0035A38E2C
MWRIRFFIILAIHSVSSQAQANATHPCFRQCRLNEKPKTCYYRFELENYHTMGVACGRCPWRRKDCFAPQCVTADGYEKGILTVNRQLPGPSIQVCEGDRVVVDVRNMMIGVSTTIHWHGILQHGSPHMDGVPMVTQCPINSGNTFRYAFNASTPGTHFWHSHDGLQKLDGIVGSFVVRQPRIVDPVSQLYDRDVTSHVLVITDWWHQDSNDRFPGHRRRDPGQNPDAYLINGLGQITTRLPTPPLGSLEPVGFTLQNVNKLNEILNNSALYAKHLVAKRSAKSKELAHNATIMLEGLRVKAERLLWPSRPTTPLAEVRVRQGLRYRLRVIGATCLVCPVRLSIERHRLIVIATDGTPVQPEPVSSVVLLAGERYDFVLEASQEIGTYWLHLQGLGPCAIERIHQVGILKYIGSPDEEPTSPFPGYGGFFPNEQVLNAVNGACGPNENGLCVTQLSPIRPPAADILKVEPDLHMVMSFGFHFYSKRELFSTNMHHRFFQPPLPLLLSGLINNISTLTPPSPLLTQWSDIPQDLFCPGTENGQPHCLSGFCECVHVVQIPLGAVIELIILDQSPIPGFLTHPFHLHGMHFWVMEIGVVPPGNFSILIEKKSKNFLEANPAPVEKDTLAVPSSGYAILRFKADNPGFWLFHCHFLLHQITGMELVIQVGTREEMAPTPTGFPKCGNYQPSFR